MGAINRSKQLEECEKEILKIFAECQAQGLSTEEILEVFSPLGAKELYCSENKGRTVWKFLEKNGTKFWMIAKKLVTRKVLFPVILFMALSLVLGRNEESVKAIRFHMLAIFRIALIKILPYWNWTEMYYSRCLVRNPFFEAPNLNVDDCNLCEALDEIYRLSNVSQTYVIDNFIRREKPFISTDAMDDWYIMNTDQFWFDNITEIYLKHDVYRVCNVNTNLRISNGDFTKLLKRLYNPRTHEWFIHWENCQKEFAKAIRQYYRRPYFVSNSLDFTGPNWILMSSDFKGRVYKKIEPADSLMMVYQLRGFNHVRVSPKETCRGHCPELSATLNEGEILVMPTLLWMFEYIPGEVGDNLAIVSEVAWPSME